jgi:hypothetical protein
LAQVLPSAQPGQALASLPEHEPQQPALASQQPVVQVSPEAHAPQQASTLLVVEQPTQQPAKSTAQVIMIRFIFISDRGGQAGPSWLQEPGWVYTDSVWAETIA